MLFVTRSVHEGDRPNRRQLPQLGHLLWPMTKLLLVASLELRPLGRIMAEPAPQLGARSHVFEPEVEGRTLPCHPTRPQPFDENAMAVQRRWILLCSLQTDHLLLSWTRLRKDGAKPAIELLVDDALRDG